jgi:hypothetical protein
MNIDLTQAPRAIQSLAAFLEQAGFTPRTKRGDGAVNRLLVLELGELGVRFVADRGQWWIEAGAASGSAWFDPDVWEACLDGTPVRIEPSPATDQADFVRRRWREMAQQVSTAIVIECLARKRSTRARERLGLPPTVENEMD